MTRPDWDEYFLALALTVSLRAEDNFIKHGCVIVAEKQKKVLSCGYNGLITGETSVDLSDRNGRRKHVIHSEINSILNMTCSPVGYYPLTAYITGAPCYNCLKHLIQFNISRIVYMDGISQINDHQDEEDRESLIERFNIDRKIVPRDTVRKILTSLL